MKSTIERQMHSNATEFLKILKSPLKFRLFLWRNLPAAWFSGVRIVQADESGSVVMIPYKWFTRNPFRSTYFACLSMAAEMSTGLLAMAHLYKRNPKVSMLVVSVEGKFYKKATGNTRFVCEEGMELKAAIDNSILTSESQTHRTLSSGYNENDELVSEFWITWSFKART